MTGFIPALPTVYKVYRNQDGTYTVAKEIDWRDLVVESSGDENINSLKDAYALAALKNSQIRR